MSKDLEILTTNIVHAPFRLIEQNGYLNFEILHPNGYTYIEIAKCYPYEPTDHFKVNYSEYFNSLKERHGLNKPFNLICLMDKVRLDNKTWWRLLICADYHGRGCYLEIRPTFHSPNQMRHWGNMLHNLSQSVTFFKDEIEEESTSQVSPWVPKE